MIKWNSKRGIIALKWFKHGWMKVDMDCEGKGEGLNRMKNILKAVWNLILQYK